MTLVHFLFNYSDIHVHRRNIHDRCKFRHEYECSKSCIPSDLWIEFSGDSWRYVFWLSGSLVKTKMSTCHNSYCRLLLAFCERTKYDSVFKRALDELSGKVDFSSVKSCVSIGTGQGLHEISFVQRFLPNLKTFVAVEQDHESVKAFKANIQAVFIASPFLI